MERNTIALWPLLMLLLSVAWTDRALAYYDPGVQTWINRDPRAERDGRNLDAFVHNEPVFGIDPFGLFTGEGMGSKGAPVKFFGGGKAYNPNSDCCQEGEIVSKIPTWQKRGYPSYAAWVGDNATCSLGGSLGIGLGAQGAGIKGGPVGVIISTALDAFLIRDQLQSMIACSSTECPKDIFNDSEGPVIKY